MKIFGIKIDNYSKEEIRKKTKGAVEGRKNLTVATLNPEMLLFAEKDSSYAKIINSFDLKIVDGFGLQLAVFFQFFRKMYRFPGADLAWFVFKESLAKKRKITLINKKNGLSCKEDLEHRFGSFSEVEIFDVESNSGYAEFALQKLQKTEILLVGLGIPEQERFIQEVKDKIPHLKVAVGVGGTLDFWSGKQKRAPRWMRVIGLEWLYRLYRQPRRYQRVINAVIVFLFKVFIKRSR
jgi:N-acetylglucosaminyldiphosphoundecaprenol N-acetyl-beta-D-mannosaminyltransferase